MNPVENPEQQIYEWVKGAFSACGVDTPPDHLLAYYCARIFAKKSSFEDVKAEFVTLFTVPQMKIIQQQQVYPLPATQPVITGAPISQTGEYHLYWPQPNAPPAIFEEPVPQLDLASKLFSDKKNETVSADKVLDFVEQLYIKYSGARGNPASTSWVVKSIQDKSYSYTQAEFFVKFSPEAKAYRASLGQKKIEQTHTFVRELFRVYAKKKPTDVEVKEYATKILKGELSYDEAEAEFKLNAL